MDENLKKIKEIIIQTAKEMNIEIDRIILFGSRARGDYREDSDYDLLIVTKEKLDSKKKFDFWYEIYKKIPFPADIIISSKETFEKFKESKGFIYSYAISEGIML
ncbi:MAG: nucleotidyltransferase domain-containing protein [Candidatus Aenigmatarchaeota archaeon]